VARRNTRELILQTSLALFNRHGEQHVSTNQIAIEADISPGNLYYHFRNRDEITLELFKRYLLSVQPLLTAEVEEAPDIDQLWLRLHLVFEAMGRFRFLFRDLPDLYARIRNFKQAFNGLLARQRSTLLNLFEGLRRRGVMQLDARQAEWLTDNILLSMTYWIPFADIRTGAGLDDGRALTEAVARVLHLVLPYLRQPEAAHLEQLARQYRAQ